MHPHRRSSMLLIASAMTLAGVDTGYADDRHQCFLESIQATFKVGTSAYHVEAGCQLYSPGAKPVPMHWSSEGTYDLSTGVAREDISIVTLGYRSTATTTLSCPSDPWLGPSFGPGMVVCSNPTFRTSYQGEEDYSFTPEWFNYLRNGFMSRIPGESSLPNSTGFQ